MGQYEDFVKSCRQKTYPSSVKLYKHHIIPRYVAKSRPKLNKFMDDPRNIVEVNYDDHKKLHRLRSEQYGKRARGDQIAFLKMSERNEEAWLELRREGARATHRHLKQRGVTFWSREFQKEMAQRSVNAPNSREVRSLGGKKGGKKRQANRILNLNDKYCFSYKGEEKVCILNCETGGDVLNELQSCIPTQLVRTSLLLTGKRKSLHGWSCTKISMTISSEAEGGKGPSERSETST